MINGIITPISIHETAKSGIGIMGPLNQRWFKRTITQKAVYNVIFQHRYRFKGDSIHHQNKLFLYDYRFKTYF